MDLLLNSVCVSVPIKSEQALPVPLRMSAPGLTSEAQMRYLLQWFGEFSELQREDFLPVLAAARGDHPEQLAATLAKLTCEDKPVSLFQCRIKLFNEWFPAWAEEDQDRLIKGVTDVDAAFGERLQELIKNGPQLNGEENGTGEAHSPIEEVKDEVVVQNEISEEVQEVEQGLIQDVGPVEIAAAS